MRIENNYEYNSIELYFDGKPDEMTRETLKMFKWKWNPKKFCWYNKNTTENMALAESLNSSAEEMRAKKIPDSYAEKYNKAKPDFFPCIAETDGNGRTCKRRSAPPCRGA